MALLGLLLAAGSAGAGQAWDLIDDRDGVQTYKQQIEGSSLLAFRGVTTLDVDISRLLGLFLDPGKCTDWIDLLAECAVVRQPDPMTTVVYQHYDISWPVADRDYVLLRTLQIDASARRVVLSFESTADPTRPVQDGVVRGVVMRTLWQMEALDGGRTRVDSEVYTDPMGALPAWLVNWVQRSWARKSFVLLEERASQPDIVPYAEIAGW